VWKSMITEVVGELHGITVENGARYFETEATVDLGDLTLPEDHLSTIGVDLVVDSAGRRRQLRPLRAQHRSGWVGQTGEAQRYALEGGSLALYPVPSTGTYKHLYVPQPADLSTAADQTTVDLITIWGRKFVVWGVASIAMHKGEDNQLRAIAERDAAREQVAFWAVQRKLHDASPRVVDDEDDGDGPCDPGDWRYR